MTARACYLTRAHGVAVIVLLTLHLVAGCGGSSQGTTPDGGVLPDGAVRDGAVVDGAFDGAVLDGAGLGDAGDAGVTHECPAGAAVCLDHASRRVCSDTAAGRRWQDEACGTGQGCVAGVCVTGACTDECNLGDTDSSRTCELYDLASQTFVATDPTASLHDRARAYNQWLRRDGMISGGVGNAYYADPPDYTTITNVGGIGDSAIWTGTYLAAEALRLKATGAADARANVIHLVEILHLWLNVTGQPGLLARFAAPAGYPFPFSIGDLNCADWRVHCGVDYNGTSYDYIGHISRDQYQGVLLGYALAYEALGEHDEATRALVRDDVVELVQELMTERTVPMKITYNGTPFPAMNITARFMVLAPWEMDDGAIAVTIDANDPDSSEARGYQEFIPDLAHILRQVPILGWLPSIPRADSAIMLASFFRVALLVTDGVPGFEATHDAIEDYYLSHNGQGGNITDWLAIAGTYTYLRQCGAKYYGHNIAMEPMYNLARLEDDPGRRATITGTILGGKMWPLLRHTKNCFFSYIYAGTVPGAEADAAPNATTQLAQFPPPPRVWVPVDLRADPAYLPHESDCVDQANHDTAVEVGQRVVSDFIWQRNPWELYTPGNAHQTMPGVDYLVAYWMGRHHGFIDEDNGGRCLVWH